MLKVLSTITSNVECQTNPGTPKRERIRWMTNDITPRVIPDNTEVLVEFLLDTEAHEIEFQIARLRPR
ncbi:hypothetical protein ACJIZ3_003633 [Penstemon smallii]|uniref:Uncharacterized protein n=1 Tax=Penstemon smallii TaxID=265156 RepID=A0ABD3UA49_9LAMI